MLRGHFSLLCLLTLTLTLSGTSVLIAQQSTKKLARQLRTSLRAIDESPDSLKPAYETIAALGKMDDGAAAQALLAGIAAARRQSGPIAAKRHKALLAGGGSGRSKRGRYELQNLDDVVAKAAEQLQAMRSQDALRVMLAQLTDRSSLLPLWLRLQLAARMPELADDQLDWRVDANGASDIATQIALLTTAAALGPRAGSSASGPWVAKQLQHDNTDVRIAAATALGQLAWFDGIEALIVHLDRERGPVREAVLDALVVLTGSYPGDAEGSWRAWLATAGKALQDGRHPLGRGDASTRQRKNAAAGSTVTGSYFGIEQTGQSILYVFDNSNSMQQPLQARRGGKGPVTGERTRWQRCKQELEQALRALPADKRFNLLAFANRIRRFEGAQVPASKANIDRAITWLRALELEFETNVYDAMELAFALAGRGTDDRYYQTDIDTLFVLSDGAPTIARLTQRGIGPDDPEFILRQVRHWNTLSRIKIHTIGLGLRQRRQQPQQPQQPQQRQQRSAKGRMGAPAFLQLLAEQNGGECRLVHR